MSHRRIARDGPPGWARGGAPLPPVVAIERAGQFIVIRHRCAEVLRDLVTAILVAAVHQTLGFRTVPHREELFREIGTTWRPETVIWAGLEPVVKAILEEAGHAVVVEPGPIVPLPSPRSPSGGSGPLDPAVVDFVRGRERGLIRLGPGVAPERLVAQVHHAFPGVGIAVAAVRREDVRRFGSQLKSLAPRACWSTGDDFPADPGPLVVATYWGLGDHGVAIHRRDILICLDAGEALGNAVQIPINAAERARLGGLARLGGRLAPYDRDRAWALFGFDALDVPAHGRVARAVEVVTGRVVGAMPGGGTAPADLKRRGIWGHPIRNRRVARLAAALGGGDPATIATALPAIAPGLPASAPGVLVLVENFEHAAGLAGLLPGWDLLAGPHVAARSLPGPTRSAPPGRPGGDAPARLRAIATLDGLDEVDLTHVDAVVRADGGVGVPRALAAGPATTGHDRGPLLLADYDDRHHPGLRSRARGRREAYLALGWTVDGRGGPASPLDRFRAARPRGAR